MSLGKGQLASAVERWRRALATLGMPSGHCRAEDQPSPGPSRSQVQAQILLREAVHWGAAGSGLPRLLKVAAICTVIKSPTDDK